MLKLVVTFATLLPALSVTAAELPTENNYSGIYDCTGRENDKDDFTGTLTLTLNPAQSTEEHGAYDFKFDVEGSENYVGHAIAFEKAIAMSFSSTIPNSKDYGIGIATVFDNQGKFAFGKYYYAPEHQGGSRGIETCVRR